MLEEHGPFDIVIDDGSHIPKHVIASFNILFPKLADDGLYVIEDVQTSFWPQFGGSVLDGGATMHLAKTILEHLNHAEIKIVQPKRQVADFVKSIRSFRAYHNIFVIEKGDNTEPSNYDYRLDNIHAARALRTIQDELKRSPTAAGYANLIDFYRYARNLPEAWAVANDALTKWPDHSGVLSLHLILQSKAVTQGVSSIFFVDSRHSTLTMQLCSRCSRRSRRKRRPPRPSLEDVRRRSTLEGRCKL